MSVIRFSESLQIWPSDNFSAIFNKEIEQLDASLLPLQQGIAQGSYITDDPFKVMIIGVTEDKGSILVKAGIFYQSIIAGCSCADDPTPVDTNQEYCVLLFTIDKETGEAEVDLLPES